MAIRKDLVWRVADDLSISPSTPQNGGVQGEDKAVRVKFILGTEHPLVKGEYQLYIECEDPTGGYDKTEVLTPDEEGAIAAEVPLAWTQYGGTVSLYVVAEGEKERILTDPASMSFRNRNGVLKRMQALIQTYIQKLLNRAEKALDSAEELAKTAEDAVETATTGAESAAESAGSAAISAQGAQMAAQTATASAGEATSAATAASLARSAAENAARNAEASADTAEQARQNAAGAVGKCSAYAMRAEESADTAEQAAKEMTEVVENGGLTFFVKDDGEGNLTFLGEGDVALAPLVVNCKDGETASHTANEIYEHIQDGGSVVLSLDGLGIAALSACTPYLASFTIVYADEGNVLYTIISVDTNKNVSVVELAGDQLIVTVDVDTMTASHTPAEMLEQIAGGSNVAIKLGDDFCALSACTAEAASFVIVFSTDEGVGIGAISIDANRAVTLKELGGGGGGTTATQVKIEGTDIEKTCIRFANLLYGTDKAESFLFFTDPHIAGPHPNEDQMLHYLNALKTYYDATPTTFAVCGGDWLNDISPLQTDKDACYKLGYVTAWMRANFDRYYTTIGNHEDNVPFGTDGKGGGRGTSAGLSNETIRNIMLPTEKNLYYSFDGAQSKCYVLNTSEFTTEADHIMTAYRWEQVAWLAKKLKEDDAENSFLLAHAAFTDWGQSDVGLPVSLLVTNALKLCEAYNSGATITLNGVTYNFAGCTGCVRFVLSGHKHIDHMETLNGIPVVCTYNLKQKYERGNGNEPTFDLCLADYDKGVLNMVRIGDGSDRSVMMATRGFSGEVFNVSLNLTNVTASNAAVNVREGDPYTNTLTVADKYILSSVVVTMGGVDVTAIAYSNGQISIANITGDISITATAIYDATSNLPGDATYVNLADPTSADWSNSGWLDCDTVKSGSGVVTNFIPVNQFDRLRFIGFDTEALIDGKPPCIVCYDENKKYISSGYRYLNEAKRGTYEGVPPTCAPDENGVVTYTVGTYMDGRQMTYASVAEKTKYIRINAMPAVPVSEIAITVNEHIFTPESRGNNLADPDSTDWVADACLAEYYEGSLTKVRLGLGTWQNEGRGTVTNFIPLVKGDVLRVKGFDWENKNNGNSPAIYLFDENKERVTKIGTTAGEYGTANGLYPDSIDENGVLTYNAYIRTNTNEQYEYADICNRAKYIRISALRNVPEGEIVITVNAEIV